jgi:A49-like RNA polymerase I associated factor
MKKKLKIKSVEANEDPATSPVLANFQHGVLQPGAGQAFTCIRATNKSTKQPNVLMVANDKSLYKGLIGEAAANDLVNTFIAVRSKTTNKMRLIQVQECHLLNSTYDSVADKPDVHLSKDVYFKNFGGKKGSSYFDKFEKQKMNVDVIKDTIEKSLENVDEKRLFIKELDLLKSQHETDILPPVKNSNNPREAYDLKDIFKEEIFKHLEVVAKAVLTTNTEDLPIKCEYILKRIQNLQLAKEPDSPTNLDKVKICVYMDALANLLAFGRKNIDGNKELSGLSSPLEQHIRDNFKPAKSSL